jgi:hypothetical protein
MLVRKLFCCPYRAEISILLVLHILHGEAPRAEFGEYNADFAECRIALLLYGTL